MNVERLARCPRYLQDLVADTAPARRAVTGHEAWRRMCEGTITPREHRNMLVGFWPLIERFPHYLALNLLKTHHGRDRTLNATRAWLARNLRVEQQHAEWYLDWAVAMGVSRDDVLDGWRPAEMVAVADWCREICANGELAEAMVATNFAIEGATGDWTHPVANSAAYRRLMDATQLEEGMRWLAAHAAYDDEHPWDALDLVAGLTGPDPGAARVRAFQAAATRSYDLYRQALDAALRYATTSADASN